MGRRKGPKRNRQKDVSWSLLIFFVASIYYGEPRFTNDIDIIIHPESGFKIDVILDKHDDFDISRFHRVKRIRPDDKHEANFASPEDVIIKKMDFFRQGKSEKHLRDITGILKISGEMLDFQYISTWSKKLGLEEIWETLKNKAAGK